MPYRPMPFRLLLALFFALAPPVARAQVLVGLPEAAPEAVVQAHGPDLRLRLILRNSGTAEAVLDLPLALAAEGDPAAPGAPVVWAQQEGSAEAAVVGSLRLAPEAEIQLIARVRLPAPGRYMLTFATGAAVHGPFAVVWAPPAVPPGLMPDAVEGQAFAYWWPRAQQPARIAVPVTNDTAVPLGRPVFAAGTVLRDGLGQGALPESQGVALPVAVNVAACPDPIPPGGGCDVVLELQGALSPGVYRLSLSATGGGGADRAALTLSVKAPAWFAAVLVGAGVLLGAAVAGWRDSGRAAALQLLPWVDLLDRLRRLTRGSPDPAVAAAARRAIDRAQFHVEAVRLSVDRPEPDIAEAQAEAAALELLAAGLPSLRQLALTKPQLAAPQRAVETVLAADPPDVAALKAAWDSATAAAQADQGRAPALGEVRTEIVAQVELPAWVMLPGPTATGPSSRAGIRGKDLGTTGILVLLTGVAAVPVWGSAPTWGAGHDLMLAFLSGVTLRLVLPAVTRPV